MRSTHTRKCMRYMHAYMPPYCHCPSGWWLFWGGSLWTLQQGSLLERFQNRGLTRVKLETGQKPGHLQVTCYGKKAGTPGLTHLIRQFLRSDTDRPTCLGDLADHFPTGPGRCGTLREGKEEESPQAKDPPLPFLSTLNHR